MHYGGASWNGGLLLIDANRPLGAHVVQVTGTASVLNHSIPNFFFHLQTAYAILRSKGVPLGKKDYIGSFLA